MNLPLSRRVFLTIAASGTALATRAQAQDSLDERDAQALAPGDVADAMRADVKKFPKFVAGQNCALFKSKAAETAGGRPLSGTRQVTAAGWCSAWAKKA